MRYPALCRFNLYLEGLVEDGRKAPRGRRFNRQDLELRELWDPRETSPRATVSSWAWPE
jgi:hypothetical protein